MLRYLCEARVLLKDFSAYATASDLDRRGRALRAQLEAAAPKDLPAASAPSPG